MFNTAFSQYHIDNGIGHYETGFSPQAHSISELRQRAFTPTVFREPTRDEYELIFNKPYNRKEQSKYTLEQYISTRISHSNNGYRAYTYAIGLLDSGYIDIDGVKPNSEGEIPTVGNVHKAMTQHNLYNVVFQSASAKPGKLRLVYKRKFMLYLEGAYNTSSNTWNLTYPKSKKVMCTNAEFPLHLFGRSLPKTIGEILKQETVYIGEILAAAGINTSGIDLTACKAHMHSKHCMVGGTSYEPPLSHTEGVAL